VGSFFAKTLGSKFKAYLKMVYHGFVLLWLGLSRNIWGAAMLSLKEGMIHCVRPALSISCFQHGQVSTFLSQNKYFTCG
jgi:hypothetical protein